MFRWCAFMWGNATSTIKFICVAVVFLVVLQVVHSFRGPVKQPASQQGGLQAAKAPAPQPSPSTTPSQKPAPTAVPTGPTPAEIRGQLQAARDRLVEASVQLDGALDSIAKWNSEIPPVLKTDAGNSVAAHDDLVDSLTKIIEVKRTPEKKLKDEAKRIARIRTDLGKRTTSASPTPLTSDEQSEIDEVEALALAANEEWKRGLTDARAVIVLGASRATPAANRTLEDHVKLKAAENRLAELEEQLKREKADRLAKEKADSERRKLEAEKKQEQDRIAAEIAEEKKRKELELLERARSAEVQTALAPFLHKRDVQPQKSGGGTIKLVATYESKPMSLAGLRSIGALAETTDGLKWLARVGGNRKMKSGPRWGVYSQPKSWSEADKELLMEAQNFLRELGPTLVGLELLSP